MKKEDGGEVPALSTQDRFGLVNWGSLSTERRRRREREGERKVFILSNSIFWRASNQELVTKQVG
jgi:hypothetical protein